MLADSAPVAQNEDLVYQFAVAPGWGRKRGLAYFAARLSGLYISKDEGQTWTSAYASLNLPEPLATLSVAAVPGSGKTASVFAGFNGGLLRSRDGGEHWETSPFATPPPALVALAVSPNYTQDSLLFAGTLQDGLLYSKDEGGHWQTGNLGLIDLNILSLAFSPDFKNDATLYVGTQSGLFLSQTSGRSWREVPLPIHYDAVLSLALSSDFAQDGTLFVGTETQGLWRSQNRGRTWKQVGGSRLSGAINQVLLNSHFAQEPQALLLNEGRLFHSTNGGHSWQLWQTALLTNRNVTALLAPQGLGSGAWVLAGLEGGEALRIKV